MLSEEKVKDQLGGIKVVRLRLWDLKHAGYYSPTLQDYLIAINIVCFSADLIRIINCKTTYLIKMYLIKMCRDVFRVEMVEFIN